MPFLTCTTVLYRLSGCPDPGWGSSRHPFSSPLPTIPPRRAVLVLWVPPSMNGGTSPPGEVPEERSLSGHWVTPFHLRFPQVISLFLWPLYRSIASCPPATPAFSALPPPSLFLCLLPQAQSMIPINEPYVDGKRVQSSQEPRERGGTWGCEGGRGSVCRAMAATVWHPQAHLSRSLTWEFREAGQVPRG